VLTQNIFESSECYIRKVMTNLSSDLRQSVLDNVLGNSTQISKSQLDQMFANKSIIS